MSICIKMLSFYINRFELLIAAVKEEVTTYFVVIIVAIVAVVNATRKRIKSINYLAKLIDLYSPKLVECVQFS